MKRSLSFSDLWTLLECPEEFLARLLRLKQKKTKEQVVGDATHAIAEQHGEQTDEIRTFIAKELAQLPEGERQETLARIQQVAANAQAMAEGDGDDDEDTDRESVYRWVFEAIGWTLCAKPDKVDVVVEDGRQILEITDYKSGSSHEWQEADGQVSYRPKRKHKEQIYFFAMVVSLSMNWTGPIRLRIRYWANKAECKPMWYSHRRTNEQLDEVAGHIRRLEEYLATKSFPKRPGFWCKHCPLAATCEGNQQALANMASVSQLPLRQEAVAASA